MITTAGLLRESVQRVPDKWAIIDDRTRITYGELGANVGSVAAFLIQKGLKKGDRIGILMSKSADGIVAFLGGMTAGGVVFPMDFSQPASSLQFVLKNTQASFLFVSEAFMGLLDTLEIPCARSRVIVVGEKYFPGTTPWRELLTVKGDLSVDRTSPDDVAYLNFTSGSTGVPKGAITTHANIYWNTRASVEALELTPDDIHLSMFPMFGHPHELFSRPLYLGGTGVLVDSVSPKAITKSVIDNRVTCMMAVASIYSSIARMDGFDAFNSSDLRMTESGGMHINPELYAELCKLKPWMCPVWGSTETTGIALARPLDGPFKSGSVGKPCPHYDIKLLDDNGHEIHDGSVGELTLHGPAVCQSYFNNPDETAGHMRNGWMHTGDLFRRDEEGYFFFAGRRSRMIKSAGLKVYPTEIEDVLCTHAAIAEVAVAGTPDRSHGEVAKAYVVFRDGMNCSEQELVKYCETKLARYKVPRVFSFIQGLPKTPSGKVLYQKLQE